MLFFQHGWDIGAFPPSGALAGSAFGARVEFAASVVPASAPARLPDLIIRSRSISFRPGTEVARLRQTTCWFGPLGLPAPAGSFLDGVSLDLRLLQRKLHRELHRERRSCTDPAIHPDVSAVGLNDLAGYV